MLPAAVLVLALALAPAGTLAQSPAPAATPAQAGPSAAPSTGTDLPPDAWALAVCTARDRVKEVPDILAALGQSALAGDEDGVSLAAITAGLAGDAALRALEGLPEAWMPGAALGGYLSAMGFALVDIGVALAETGLSDLESLRIALGNSIAAYDSWRQVELAETALRETTGFDCAAVPVPSPEPFGSPEPATPAPSIVGDVELMDRFPAEIGGVAVEVESRTGPELIATQDPNDEIGLARLDDLEAFLAANGHTIEDISLAFAFVPTDDGFGVSITAFRVKGGDAAALLEGLIPLITIDFPDEVVQETVTIAGRELVRVSSGPYDPSGVYEVLVPSGDTVWAVSAADPVLTEIVQAFPA
jgi:hypothetical protein